MPRGYLLGGEQGWEVRGFSYSNSWWGSWDSAPRPAAQSGVPVCTGTHLLSHASLGHAPEPWACGEPHLSSACFPLLGDKSLGWGCPMWGGVPQSKAPIGVGEDGSRGEGRHIRGCTPRLPGDGGRGVAGISHRAGPPARGGSGEELILTETCHSTCVLSTWGCAGGRGCGCRVRGGRRERPCSWEPGPREEPWTQAQALWSPSAASGGESPAGGGRSDAAEQRRAPPEPQSPQRHPGPQRGLPTQRSLGFSVALLADMGTESWATRRGRPTRSQAERGPGAPVYLVRLPGGDGHSGDLGGPPSGLPGPHVCPAMWLSVAPAAVLGFCSVTPGSRPNKAGLCPRDTGRG